MYGITSLANCTVLWEAITSYFSSMALCTCYHYHPDCFDKPQQWTVKYKLTTRDFPVYLWIDVNPMVRSSLGF